MSSVGFSSGVAKELEQLREAWKSLNALLKNIENAEACLANHDLKLTADHLKVAKWNVRETKRSIKAVGQSRQPKVSGSGIPGATGTPAAESPEDDEII